MMKLKNYLFAATSVMMLAACSVNEDNPSGDTPVPTESYETVLNYFKEINAVPRPSRQEEISSIEHAWTYLLELLRKI